MLLRLLWILYALFALIRHVFMVELVLHLHIVGIRPVCSGRHEMGSITGTHVSILFLAARHPSPCGERLQRTNNKVRKNHVDGRIHVLTWCIEGRHDMWLSFLYLMFWSREYRSTLV